MRITAEVSKRVLEMYKNNFSITNISRQIGICRESVREILKQNKVYKKPANRAGYMKEVVLQDIRDGKTNAFIARKYLIDEGTVRRWRKVMEVK